MSLQDLTTAETAIREIFEDLGIEIKALRGLEPMMGGYRAGLDTDGFPMGPMENPNAIERESLEISVRDGRSFIAINGSMKWNDTRVAFQGELATYGPHVETADEARMQIWIGDNQIPNDVRKAFHLEHEKEVANSAFNQLYVAASKLENVSDEAIRLAAANTLIHDVERIVRDAQVALRQKASA